MVSCLGTFCGEDPLANQCQSIPAKHTQDREALLLQASNSAPVEINNQKQALKDWLLHLERTDQKGFLRYLIEFSTKFFGSIWGTRAPSNSKWAFLF